MSPEVLFLPMRKFCSTVQVQDRPASVIPRKKKENEDKLPPPKSLCNKVAGMR